MTTQGGRIKQLAAAHKLNLTQLAARSGIDRPSISKIANDKIGLGEDRAQQIAVALGVDVSEVLLPKAEAVTLASVDRRLLSLAAELEDAVKGQATLAREVRRLRGRVERLEARSWPDGAKATGG